jgi:uncharacterized membrane protein
MIRSESMLHTLRTNRQLPIVASLVLSSAICILLLIARVLYSRTFIHDGMLWNLSLAWLPLLCALAAYNLAGKDARGNWLIIAGCALIWLLFFPNAPYILTDIGNLRPRMRIPFWYDTLMFVAFAWTGTFLGLVSLYLMQALVRRVRGVRASWLFAVGVLVLSSFGVYLGRFPRWNSWDMLVSPLRLLADIWDRLAHPLANSQMYIFSALYSLFLISVYLVLVAMVQFQREVTHG